MAPGQREFVLADAAGAGSDVLRALTAAAEDGLGWANGGAVRSRRRTWLDTFDWRLYRAGLTLEQVVSGGRAELILTGRDGAVVATEGLPAGSRPAWPSLAAQLPAGPLQTALEPVTGPRALTPVARAVSKLAELQALNGDAKTIARLAVDRVSVTFPARAALPARLTLVPVRGYQAQVDRVGRTILGLPASSPGTARPSKRRWPRPAASPGRCRARRPAFSSSLACRRPAPSASSSPRCWTRWKPTCPARCGT